jgi:membrane protein DedA with SNARE-associated domain
MYKISKSVLVSLQSLLPAGIFMDHIITLVSFGAAFVGLIAGYFVGYRSGTVAGELAALKSIQHRHDRESSSYRHRRSSSEKRSSSDSDRESTP